MKKIKLKEAELTKIIEKVIKEQQSPDVCQGGGAWLSEGYEQTSGGYYKKNISPALSFYIKSKPRTQDQYCNFELFWGDGMRPIDIGGPDFCYSIAEAYEKAFKMKRAK